MGLWLRELSRLFIAGRGPCPLSRCVGAVTYSVKEMFPTLQGEGGQAGRAAVFCRFAGCNLWSGLEAQRHEAVCQFCDTDFVGTDGPGGGKFADASALADQIAASWGERPSATQRCTMPQRV